MPIINYINLNEIKTIELDFIWKFLKAVPLMNNSNIYQWVLNALLFF